MSAAIEGELDQAIPDLPKVELHRHLAGCLTPEIVLELGQRFGADVPGRTVEEIRPHVEVTRQMASLNEVLGCFKIFQRLFPSADAVRHAAYRAVQDAARDNVRYLELRFSPGFTACGHGLAQGAVFEAVIAGAEEAAARHGVILSLIAISSREMGPEVCMETVKLAARFKAHVAAVDLAGNEDDYPPDLFVGAFEHARSEGLQATVHAGEQAHPDNVRKAIELLHATRIGHGGRIVDRPDLVDLVKRKNVALEVCITSNYIVSAVPSVEEHPVCRLRSMGVPVVVCADDPALFGITLSGELRLFRKLCGLSVGDLVRHEADALKYGFAGEVAKGVVRNQIHEWWGRSA